MRVDLKSFLSLVACFFAAPFAASAHEAYVLPYDTFWKGMSAPLSGQVFEAFKDPRNIQTTVIIVASVLIVLGLNFLFRRSALGSKVHTWFERYARFGPHFARLTAAVAFLFSALSMSFLGPELHLSLLSHPHLVQIALFAMSAMIALGFLTELAALIGLALFVWGLFVFGQYMLTYLNYLGEFVVLLLFGLRVFSVDKILFGPLRRFGALERYETLIIRVFYGLALIYAAVTVKLLHPGLTIDVVNTWHLTQFHWLFPSDPLLVTFGAGIVEAVIGLFIIFGFEMRLTVFVSLFYITLSLFYFRELVWPHLLLYGISFNLLVQPETFTLDHLFSKEHRRTKAWWKRPFAAHNKEGKSS